MLKKAGSVAGPAGKLPLPVRDLEYAMRRADAIALCVIDAQATEHVDDLLVLGKLGDGLFAGKVADLINGADHFAVDGVVEDFFDEAAVDLEKVDRKVLEITERR